ncbi:hypothetical protein PR048_017287 [Dryococelus australis]|uniref:Uncharacterized protein n=1 Tax=Dryococelus australis TaxID=614101 RepID=A0ABQ9H937_9NEOP|nr:hypothetical protein PR048_017287 [Dryococelus australis]
MCRCCLDWSLCRLGVWLGPADARGMMRATVSEGVDYSSVQRSEMGASGATAQPCASRRFRAVDTVIAECSSSAVALDICSIVSYFQDYACHKTAYTKHCGVHVITNVPQLQKDVLLWRCGIKNASNTSVPVYDAMNTCFHHFQVFCVKYTFLQRTCYDPFRIHKKSVKCSLRETDIPKVQKVKLKTGEALKPGQKLQPKWHKTFDELNESVISLGCSPLKPPGYTSERNQQYGRRKLKEAEETVKCKVQAAFGIPEKELTRDVEPLTTCAKCSDDLRTKLRQARKLKETKEILPDIEPCRFGKVLPTVIKNEVISFYEDDENSRLCPDKNHGKNICDDIGGTIARLVARASLQRPMDGHILTPHQLFAWVQGNIRGIESFFVSKEEVRGHEPGQCERMKTVTTVAGTRSHHFFSSVNCCELDMSRLYSPNYRYETVVIVDSIKLGYESKWYLGYIVQCSPEEGDVLLNCTRPAGPSRSFSWPQSKDEPANLDVTRSAMCDSKVTSVGLTLPSPQPILLLPYSHPLPLGVTPETGPRGRQIQERHALYECLQDIHGDPSLFLLQRFHELRNGFWPRLTSSHPAIQFVPKMFYRVAASVPMLPRTNTSGPTPTGVKHKSTDILNYLSSRGTTRFWASKMMVSECRRFESRSNGATLTIMGVIARERYSWHTFNDYPNSTWKTMQSHVPSPSVKVSMRWDMRRLFEEPISDTMKEHKICKSLSTGDQQVLLPLPRATSMGIVSADDYDKTVNANDVMRDLRGMIVSMCGMYTCKAFTDNHVTPTKESKLNIEDETGGEDDHDDSIVDTEYCDNVDDLIRTMMILSTFVHISPTSFLRQVVRRRQKASRTLVTYFPKTFYAIGSRSRSTTTNMVAKTTALLAAKSIINTLAHLRDEKGQRVKCQSSRSHDPTWRIRWPPEDRQYEQLQAPVPGPEGANSSKSYYSPVNVRDGSTVITDSCYVHPQCTEVCKHRHTVQQLTSRHYLARGVSSRGRRAENNFSSLARSRKGCWCGVAQKLEPHPRAGGGGGLLEQLPRVISSCQQISAAVCASTAAPARVQRSLWLLGVPLRSPQHVPYKACSVNDDKFGGESQAACTGVMDVHAVGLVKRDLQFPTDNYVDIGDTNSSLSCLTECSGKPSCSHSGGHRFDSRPSHTDLRFPWLSVITPGECWDEPSTTGHNRFFDLNEIMIENLEISDSVRHCRKGEVVTTRRHQATPSLSLKGIGTFRHRTLKENVVRLLASHLGAGHGAERLACSPPTKAIRIQSPAGSFRIFACGNNAGRFRWSAGFLGDLPFPPPLHSGTAPYSSQSPSSALKTLMLGAAQISPLPPSRTGFDSRRCCFWIFACGNRARRCYFSVGFLGDLLFPPPLHSCAAQLSPCFTLIVSQDLAVNSCLNLHSTPTLAHDFSAELPKQRIQILI